MNIRGETSKTKFFLTFNICVGLVSLVDKVIGKIPGILFDA